MPKSKKPRKKAAQAERVNHMKVTGKLPPPPPLPAN